MGMRNLLQGFINDGMQIMIGVVVLMAVAFVIMTWNRTRSAVPVIGAILLGGVIIWGVSSYTVLKDTVRNDVDRNRGQTNTTIAEQQRTP
jgi:hypothetical protein